MILITNMKGEKRIMVEGTKKLSKKVQCRDHANYKDNRKKRRRRNVEKEKIYQKKSLHKNNANESNKRQKRKEEGTIGTRNKKGKTNKKK